MAIQIRTNLNEPETGDNFTPHRPSRPDKAEGGRPFKLVSEYEPSGDQPTAIAELVGQAREGERDSAADRLKKWCRGEHLGWALDGERDELDMCRRLTGIDTTALLKDEIVCSPVLAHIFYRVRKLINGRPLVLGVDEA